MKEFLIPVVLRVNEINIRMEGVPRLEVRGHIVMQDGTPGTALTTVLPMRTGLMQAAITEIEMAFGKEAVKFLKGFELVGDPHEFKPFDYPRFPLGNGRKEGP